MPTTPFQNLDIELEEVSEAIEAEMTEEMWLVVMRRKVQLQLLLICLVFLLWMLQLTLHLLLLLLLLLLTLRIEKESL